MSLRQTVTLRVEVLRTVWDREIGRVGTAEIVGNEVDTQKKTHIPVALNKFCHADAELQLMIILIIVESIYPRMWHLQIASFT